MTTEKAAAKKAEKVKRFSGGLAADDDGFLFTDIDMPQVFHTIAAVVGVGAAITFSLTKDKRGLIISVYFDNDRTVLYANGPVDAYDRLEQFKQEALA